MSPTRFLYIISLAVLTVSCVSDFHATLPSSYDDILVVDGNIVENTEVVFHLSKSFDMSQVSLPDANKNIDATLVLVGSDGTRSEPAVSAGKGSYKLAVGELKDNVSYSIEIKYDGDTYLSEPAMALRTPEIDSITWNQPEQYGPLYFQVSTHGDQNTSQYYMWNYEEDWEFTAAYSVTIFFDLNTGGYYEVDVAPYFYCWKNSTINEIMVGSTETLIENRLVKQALYSKNNQDDRFSYLYSVNVGQRSISKAAYEYYLNKKKLNEDMGGLFTPQPSEVTGNISCQTDPSKKVIGFINVSKNITEKRIFINSSEVSHRNIYYQYCVENTPPEDMPESLSEAYTDGYRPAYEEGEDIIWSTEQCTDCRKNGGTKVRPDFWPNNHK